MHYELTKPQQAIYEVEQFGTAQMVSNAFYSKMDGQIPKQILKQILHNIIMENDVFHIRLHRENGKVYQDFEYQPREISVFTFKEEAEFLLWAEEERNKPVSIQGELFRLTGIILKGSFGYFAVIHHILADGYSMNVLFEQFLAHYTQYKEMGTVEFIPAPSFQEYLKQEQKYYESKRYQLDIQYWKEQTVHSEDMVKLTGKISTKAKAMRKAFKISTGVLEEIQCYCQQNSITPYHLFLTLYASYFQQFSRQDSVNIGTSVLNRNKKAENHMIAMLVNTCFLNLSPDKERSLTENCLETAGEVLKLFRHQRLHYSEVRKIAYEINQYKEKYFDISFNYHPMDPLVQEGTIYWYPCGESAEGLNIHAFEQPDGSLHFYYDYREDLYASWEIEWLHSHILKLLRSSVAHADLPLKELVYVDGEEQKLIAGMEKGTAHNVPFQTIQERIEENVRKNPNMEILECNGTVLTYGEWNKRVNQFAHYLIGAGVEKEDRIAVMLPKTIERYIVLFSVVKAGGAFVPIDPAYPKERIRYMIKDSGAKWLVTANQEQEHILAESGCVPIMYEEENYHIQPEENPSVIASETQLAYIIYTSGTTGNPKGVMVEQKGILNLAAYFENDLKISQNDRILQFANYVFDGSIWEMTMAFLCGAKLCAISDDAIRQESQFRSYIKEQKVTVMALPVPYFEQLDVSGLALRIVITAGSASSREVVKKALTCADMYVNSYGPTEATVAATHWVIHRGETMPDNITIGCPIQNAQIQILDQNGKLCGIGFPGELCVAGMGVARGYRNLEERTKESFVVKNGIRWYRTGDMARWQPNGMLEYLGRIDDQVKLRGFRVELSEIEMVLKKENGIQDACVIVRNCQGHEQVLCAYISGKEKPDIGMLRQKLMEFLPDYMIPDAFLWMVQLPVTVNGKIDKRALPEPEFLSETSYEEPQTLLEQNIAKLFGEVLGNRRIGRNTRFFECGGHSLSAIRFLNLLEDKHHYIISYKQFLQNQTPEQLASVLEQKGQEKEQLLHKAAKKDVYPMSSNQKRMFVLNQLPDSGTAYNAPTVWKVRGILDCGKLKDAFEQIVSRHEILRTRLYVADGNFVQEISEDVRILFQIKEVNRAVSLEEVIGAGVRKINLEQDPLVQVTVVKEKEQECFVVLNLNHAVADGRSIEILKEELCAIYQDKSLSVVEFQYKDYSEWECSRSYEKEAAFWKKKLEGELPLLDFPLDMPRGKERSFEGATVALAMSLNKEVGAFCQRVQSTEYQFYLSTLMILLARFSRQEDVLIGTPILGRNSQKLMDIMGMFVNTIVMRGYPEANKQYKAFLQEVVAFCNDAYEYQNYPLEEVLKEIEFDTDPSRNPLFDVMFVYEKKEADRQKIEGLSVEEISLNSTIAKFDMTFTVQQSEDGTRFVVEYATSLFQKETMETVLGYWKQIIEKLIKNPETKIGELSLINEEIKPERIVRTSERISVVRRLEEMVRAYPERIAVSFKDKELTYEAFNKKANQIAHYFRKQGIGRNDFVVLLCERCLELLPAIYGILKCGAAYVPLDPKQPAMRLMEIITDCKPKAVITGMMGCPVIVDCPVISVDDLVLKAEDTKNPEPVNERDDLCYMIYTSGTTGKPKGVMITHGNLENFLRIDGSNQFQQAIVQTCDSVYMTNSIIFDITVQEIQLPLSYGKTVILSEKELMEFTNETKEQLLRYGKPGLIMTPSKLLAYMENKAFLEVLPHTAVIMAGAERFAPKLFEKLRMFTKAAIFNGYGPTETTCGISYYLCEEPKENMPIGTVLEGNHAYIMTNGMPNPVLVPGELCITGENVAKGYFGDEEKTKEKFRKNPLGDGVMYHTGDLARFLLDGTLEYLGRMDQQVKIRGFRIETAEIERRICNISGIVSAAVLVKEAKSGEPVLCAYYCAEKETSPDVVEEELQKTLPEYMIPARLMQLDRLPMGKTGKLDTKALPEITEGRKENYVAPESETKKIICQVVSEVLQIEKAGLRDSFYQLGGDSIKAIRIVSKLREHGYTVLLAEFLKAADLETLARKAVKTEGNEDQETVTGVVPLTPIQKEFFRWNLKEPNHFNQAMLLKMEGGYEEACFKVAIEALVNHHDMLRAVYAKEEQCVLPVDEAEMYQLEQFVLSGSQDYKKQIEEDTKRIQRSISLEEGPLLHVGVWQLESRVYILLVIHHLVVDHVSWQILLEDLETAYNQAARGETITLPKKTASFKQWAKDLQEYSKSSQLKKEETYWNGIYEESRKQSGLEGMMEELEVSEETERYGAITLELDKADTEKFKRAGSTYSMDVSEVLLAAFGLSLGEWTGEGANIVCMEGHGREAIHKTVYIDRTVGWFTSVYPVLLKSNTDYEKALIETKEMVRNIPNHGMGFLLLQQKEGSKLREIPMKISFNYLGEVTQEKQEGTFLPAEMEAVEPVSRKNRYVQYLMLNGRIFGGKLILELSFDRTKLKEQKVKQLAELFEEKIRAVQNVCLQQEEVVKTASDYHAKGLTNDVLEELMDMF